MGIGYQPAQCPVAGPVVVAAGEDHHPAGELGAVVTVVVEDREVHSDNGIDTRSHACFEVFDGAVQTVAVRARER